MIGSGFQSEVYDSKNSNIVLKVAKVNSNTSPLIQFIKLAKNSTNLFFPKIYNYRLMNDKLFIRMEKLQPITDKSTIKTIKQDPLFKEIITQLTKISSHLDLHDNNFMMRNNNQAVLVDPFQPEPEEVYNPNKIDNQIILLQTMIQPIQQNIDLLKKDQNVVKLGTCPKNTSKDVMQYHFNNIPSTLKNKLLSMDYNLLKQIRNKILELEEIISKQHLERTLELNDMIDYYTYDFYIIANAHNKAKRVLNC